MALFQVSMTLGHPSFVSVLFYGYSLGKAEVARKMVAKGADIEFIVEITGLTPGEIEALK
jgi:hypothetical protein